MLRGLGPVLVLVALLRGRGTFSAVLAVGFLAAVVASVSSLVNFVGAQSERLADLVGVGGAYILVERGAEALAGSRVGVELVYRLLEVEGVDRVFPQRLLVADLEAFPAGVRVRAVGDLEGYLRLRAVCLSGGFAGGGFEASVGELLAAELGVSASSVVRLTINGRSVDFTVACVHRALSALDAEVLIPLDSLSSFSVDVSEVSLVEFTLKPGAGVAGTLRRLEEVLPSSVQVVKVQQPGAFVEGLNAQLLAFLNVWSLAVYAAVALASYVVVVRLAVESAYELAMLRALGAGRLRVFAAVVGYAAVVAALGGVLGVALGLVVAQVVSRVLWWLAPSAEVSPFLEAGQALGILLMTLASSVLGCLWPAYRSACSEYAGYPL